MYTADERNQLREALIALAQRDDRITGAALTGSAALDREDGWSDIDLAFGVSPSADFEQTMADWTDVMYQSHGALHHLDVASGASIYRVFLLDNTLQVDLAFSPAEQFGARAPTFRLLFGTAAELPQATGPSAAQLIGWGWLYALHARSSLARGRLWQAEYMISGMRDQVLALACLRHGLPTSEGRGVDDLPVDVAAPISESLVGSLDVDELSAALRVVVKALIVEIGHVDETLADRLTGALRDLPG